MYNFLKPTRIKLYNDSDYCENEIAVNISQYFLKNLSLYKARNGLNFLQKQCSSTLFPFKLLLNCFKDWSLINCDLDKHIKHLMYHSKLVVSIVSVWHGEHNSSFLNLGISLPFSLLMRSTQNENSENCLCLSRTVMW